ncbi:hypothetical protein P3G55_08660 [Leptospira sp. 96542]|nr:hypothetical protein [Leptospira sp. 96542]
MRFHFKLSLLFAVSLLLSSLIQCSVRKNYQLRDAHPSLSHYQNSNLNPLQLTPYSHSVFGNPVYDGYLEETYRTIIQTRFAESAVRNIEAELGEGKIPGESKDAYAFAYRELPILKLKLDKLHYDGLALLTNSLTDESENLKDKKEILKNEITFGIEEIQYLRKGIDKTIERSKPLFAKVYSHRPTTNSATATKLPIHNPHNSPMFLSKKEDICYATREYRQWFILWGTIRMSKLSLEELFPDPNQSYRFEEKATALDIISLIPLISPVTTVTTKTIRVDVCESEALAEYRTALGEREIYKTLLAKEAEAEKEVATEEEVSPIPKASVFKKVALIQLASGIVLQGDITGFSETTVKLETTMGPQTIEKETISKIRYTQVEVKLDEKGEPI